MVDSVRMVYPAASVADSVSAKLVADSLKVSETDTKGIYNVYLGNNQNIKVKVAEDGKMSVTESKGIFAYPESDIKFAKATGLTNGANTDVQLAERMKELEPLKIFLYQEYVSGNTSMLSISKKITVTYEPMYGMDEGKGYYTIKNLTDMPVSGSEYTVAITYETVWNGFEETNTYVEKGVNVPANGSSKINVSFSMHSYPARAKIIMKSKSREEFESIYSPKGDEYKRFKASNFSK